MLQRSPHRFPFIEASTVLREADGSETIDEESIWGFHGEEFGTWPIGDEVVLVDGAALSEGCFENGRGKW